MKSNNPPLCRYFLHGACIKGASCPFNHDLNSKPDMTCRYYLTGNCFYGSKCRYDHVRPKSTALPLEDFFGSTIGQTASKPKNEVTSFSYAKMVANSSTAIASSSNSINPWNQNQSPLSDFDAMSDQVSSIANMPLDQISLCPYYEMGFCANGAECDVCDMCGKTALHPYNENQKKKHHRECLAEHEKAMEEAFAEARSIDKQCGICMEQIIEKNLRFGILQNCKHCFCLSCIRNWRKSTNSFEAKTVRSCPECRVHSDYIIPSSIWVEDQEEKDRLINIYKGNMKEKICKYMKSGQVDDCPFGNKCFYKHQLPNGQVIEGDSPRALRRRRKLVLDLFSPGLSSDSEDDDEVLSDLVRSLYRSIAR